MHKNLQNFQASNIYCNNKLFNKKCAKSKSARIMIKLHFRKPSPRQIQICKNIWKNLKNKIFIEGELQILKENCKYSTSL